MQKRAAALLRSGDTETGLATFVQSVGGDWSQLPEPFKAIFRHNAHVYAGKAFFDDPAMLPVPDEIRSFPHPILFTKGERSPRFFHVSIDRVAASLPRAELETIEGGHAAMLEHPAEYARVVSAFIERTAARARGVGPKSD